jgi:phasin family protein
VAQDRNATGSSDGQSIPPALAAKPKQARAPKRPEPEAIAVPIEADIAAVTIVDAPALDHLEITPAAAEPAPAILPTAAAPAEQPQKETDMATTAETITNSANTAAPVGAKMFADMNDRAKGAMERGSKLVEEMNGMTKGNVDALVESGRIAIRGMEQMGRESADYARRSFEQMTANMRALAAVKSPTELMKLQAEQTRTAFDQAVAQTSHSTEAMLKLAGEVVQPISNRFAVVADRVRSAA